jgi:hypothetical protein
MIILLDNFIKVHRLSAIGGNKSSYTTWTTTLDCTIQPLGDEKTAMAGGAYGKMFKIFLDVDKDIKQDDKLIDRDGNIYKVVAGGVENRNDGYMADYLGITAQKLN